MSTHNQRITMLEAKSTRKEAALNNSQLKVAMHAYWAAIGCWKPLSWDATKFSLSVDHTKITASLAMRITSQTLTDDDKRILAAIPEHGDTPESLVLLLYELETEI